jgi:hypothetical protein
MQGGILELSWENMCNDQAQIHFRVAQPTDITTQNTSPHLPFSLAHPYSVPRTLENSDNLELMVLHSHCAPIPLRGALCVRKVVNDNRSGSNHGGAFSLLGETGVSVLNTYAHVMSLGGRRNHN